MKNFIRTSVFLAAWILVVMMTAAANWAASPGVGTALTDASPQSEDALSAAYRGIGVVDRIGAGEIVIDDVLFRLSPSVSYFSEGGAYLGSASFSAGTLVGYALEAEGERVIHSLWKLAPPSQP